MIGGEYTTEKDKCPQCGTLIDTHRAVGSEGSGPHPGNFSICFRCLGINVWDENIKLIMATDEIINKLKEEDPDTHDYLFRAIGALKEIKNQQ